MAVNIGPKIGLEGESEYRKAIQNIIQQQKTLNSELAKTTSAFDKDTSAVQKAKAQREALTKQIQLQEQRVLALTEQMQKCRDVEGESSDKTLKWQQAVNEATAELNKLNQELQSTPSYISAVGQDMEAFGDKVKGIGDKVTDLGTSITKLTAPLTALAGYSIKASTSLEDGMAKVYTIADDTVVSLDDMKKNIISLSNESGKSATELAEAMYDALSASVDTADALEFTATASNLARAGFLETSGAVDVLTTIINAYGMSASDAQSIADKLVKTQDDGKVTVQELANSMGTAIPTAAAYNVSLDDLATSYVILTKQGIDANKATTYVSRMMTELADSGSDVASILQEETGMSFGQLMASGNSLADVLNVLYGTVDGDSEAFANLFGNVNSSRAALAIMNMGASEYNEELSAMSTTTGNVSNNLETLSTTSYTFQTALNELKNSATLLGDALLTNLTPVITALSTGISELTTWFNNLDPSTQQLIASALLLVASLGPVLVIGGKIIGGVGTLISSGGQLVQWIGNIGTSAGGIASNLASSASGIASMASASASGVGSVASMATSFGQLAGQALSLVALGAGILLAAEGIKALAEAAVEVSSGGVGAVATMGLMVVAVAGLAAGAATLGPALTAGSLGFVAFGAAMVGIGAGVDLICQGVATLLDSVGNLSPELENIGTYGGTAALAITELAGASTLLGVGATAAATGIGLLDVALAAAALTFAAANLAMGSYPKDIEKIATHSTTASTSMQTLNTSLKNAKPNFEAIKTSADNFKKSVKDLNSTVNSSTNSMSNKFNNLATSLQSSMDRMTNQARSSLSSLQSVFANTKLSLNTHIAVPHFSMWGSFNAQTGSVPNVSVSWYKKAYQNAILFKTPTVMATANGYKGFGDGVGSEMVIGTNTLMNTIRSAVSPTGNGMTINMTINASDGMDTNELADKVMSKINNAIKRQKGAFAV